MLNMMNDIITTVKKRLCNIEQQQNGLREGFNDVLANPWDANYAFAFSVFFNRWKRQYGDIDEPMPMSEPEDIMLMRKVNEVKAMLKRFRRDVTPDSWNRLVAMAV